MITLNSNVAFNNSIAKELHQQTTNVVQHFYAQTEKNPNEVAIIDGNEQITYAELKTEVLKTVRYFRLEGIQKADRVLVFVPVSISLYRIVLALFHIGATAVFLDEWSSNDRLKKACQVADCKAYIGNWKAKALGLFLKPIRNIPIWLSTSLPYYEAIEEDAISVIGSDRALITFTTGSTGIPKAANRTHHFLSAQMDALQEELSSTPGMIDMPALPIFVLLNLGSGTVSILPNANMRKPETIKIHKIVKQLQKHKVERIIASPFLIKAIAKHLVHEQIQLPNLKEVYTGGAPIFPQDAQLFLKGFGDQIKMEAVFGSTEAEPISSIPMQTLAESEISNGLPVGEIAASAKVKVIQYKDEVIEGSEFTNSVLPIGSIGEIVVSGEHVLKEYYKNPEAVLRNKIKHENTVWHRTGDAGYLDQNGHLHLVGRCAQLIHLNDKMYSPFLYEYLLQQIDGVRIGTLVKSKGSLTVVIETNGNYDQTKLNNIFKGEEFRIVNVSKIPKDPRHHSKIDYASLEKEIGL